MTEIRDPTDREVIFRNLPAGFNPSVLKECQCLNYQIVENDFGGDARKKTNIIIQKGTNLSSIKDAYNKVKKDFSLFNAVYFPFVIKEKTDGRKPGAQRKVEDFKEFQEFSEREGN